MQDFDTAQLIALAGVLGFASGVRLYAVLFAVGLAGWLGWLPLPPGLQMLAHPWMLGASGLMMAIEFFADKIPLVDSFWDAVHTFIRIPGGAALAAAAFAGLGVDATLWAALAALAGGSLAATSHFTKASARMAVNTSPEPVSNIAVSAAEDVSVVGLLWLLLANPWVAIGALLVLLVLAVWVLLKLARFVRTLFERIRGGGLPAS
jgi:hypothetical protein